MNDIPEIKLGTILFSLAEPKPGHEREYNRWYERDHFFAGCMVGANFFSARRWVATKPLKASIPMIARGPNSAITSFINPESRHALVPKMTQETPI